jgi:hypothetical protein
MTISTTPRGYRYPESDEPVTNGWDAIRDLAEDLDADLSASGLVVSSDPEVHSNLSGWPLGDFGGTPSDSGNTYQCHTVERGIVDAWGLAVLFANGPAFPPAPAAPTFVRLPVAPTGLAYRHLIGHWQLISHDDTGVNAGTIRYDVEHVSGQHWGRLDKNLNTSFQYQLAYHLRYPLDMP